MDVDGRPSHRTPVVLADHQDFARRIMILGMNRSFIKQELYLGEKEQGPLATWNVKVDLAHEQASIVVRYISLILRQLKRSLSYPLVLFMTIYPLTNIPVTVVPACNRPTR